MVNINKTDWDLTPILKSEDQDLIDEELAKIKEAYLTFTTKWKNREDYLRSPKILKQALDEYENLSKNYGASGNPGYYYSLRFYIDQTDPEVKAKKNKIEETEKQVINELQFFTLNIGKIPSVKQEKFLSSPELKDYKHSLENIFESAKHMLSEPEEKIITLKENTSHDIWEDLTANLLVKQEREVLLEDNSTKKQNFSEIDNLLHSPNKKVRESAAKAFNQILDQYVEVAETEINAILSNKKVNDVLRKFPRPDSARHLEDDIQTSTVDTLVKTISNNFHVPKRFYKLKAQLLKLDKIPYSERAAPYGENHKKYPYQEAIDLVHKTFQNLSPQFSEILERFIEKNQIDAFPKKGKHNGAFCIDYLQTQPTYVMLNHADSLNDVTIIAHEMGHAIHKELMNAKQNALNAGTPKSTAEVASTFMEDFVLQELLKEATEEEKLSIMIEKLDGDMSSIFRQTAFYNFETELHNNFRKQGYLSKEEIGELFKKHMDSYMGDAIDTSESPNWWIYVPHFRYFFYVYSYTAGLLISKALQSKVKQNPEFIEKVKDFLSAGTSDSPKNIFLNLGIDITKEEFWLSGIKEISNLLTETENLAKKLGKI